MSGLGWASTGFDAMDDADNNYGSGGLDGPRILNYWTPFVPTEKGGPVTKLILLLDDDPFSFWQHSMYAFSRKAGDNEICLDRNKIGKCPICEVAKERKCWPQFVGYLTVIDCGEVTFGSDEDEKERMVIEAINGWDNGKSGSDHKVWQFGKKLMPLKKGGKDKPGLLQKLRRLKERKGGSLVGTLWAVTRTGQKQEVVGDEWEYRGRVKVNSVLALKRALVDLPGSPLSDHEDEQIADLTPDAINYADHFQPKSYDQLKNAAGLGGYSSQSSQSAPVQKSNSGGFDDDGDIPF